MSEHPRQVLILFAHPALQKSRVNRRLRQEVMDLPGVTFHDLYEAYPQLDVDAAREQALLEAHDASCSTPSSGTAPRRSSRSGRTWSSNTAGPTAARGPGSTASGSSTR